MESHLASLQHVPLLLLLLSVRACKSPHPGSLLQSVEEDNASVLKRPLGSIIRPSHTRTRLSIFCASHP